MCLNTFSAIAVIISSNLKSGNDCLSPSLICWRIRFQSPTDIVIRALTRTSSALSMDIDASYLLGSLMVFFRRCFLFQLALDSLFGERAIDFRLLVFGFALDDDAIVILRSEGYGLFFGFGTGKQL